MSEIADKLRFAKEGSWELDKEIARFLNIPPQAWTQRDVLSVSLLEQVPGWRQYRYAVQEDGICLINLLGPEFEKVGALGHTFALAMCGAVIEVVLAKQAEAEALYEGAS